MKRAPIKDNIFKIFFNFIFKMQINEIMNPFLYYVLIKYCPLLVQRFVAGFTSNFEVV